MKRASDSTTNKLQNLYQNKVMREKEGAAKRYIDRLVIGAVLIK